MLPGETIFGGAKQLTPCDLCNGTAFPLQVMHTPAGYYVGTACADCGAPESRETGYYQKVEDAEMALMEILSGNLQKTRAVDAGMAPGAWGVGEG